MANPHADPSAQGSNASRLLSFLLALLMHVGLGTLLFVGIDWQKPQPEVVQAELWIPMEDLPAPEEAPEAPAPEPEPQPAPEPPPPPPKPAPAPEPEPVKAEQPDPAIAIAKAKEEAERKAEEERRREEEKRRLAEEEKKRQEAEARERERARQAELERQRAEEKRQREEAQRKEQERKAEEARKEAERKAAEEKKREEQKKQEEARQRKLAQEKAEKAAAQKAAAEKAAAQRQAAEARRKAAVSALLSQAGDADSTTIHGSTSGARDAGYAARVSSAIRNNTTFFQQISGNPKAVFDVRLDRDGRIQDVRLKQSSGNAAWDSAAERAIRRTDPFPCPRSGSCESTLEIHHGPQD